MNPGTESLESRTGPHYPSLDGIRGLAIALVLIHNPDENLLTSSLGDWVFGAAMHVGWIGVQLFFVLSGFLITDHLLRSQAASNYYAAFFGRRFLRIFPLYYAVLLFFFVVLPAADAQPQMIQETAQHQIWLWTFLYNWAAPLGHGVHGFGHFWSLAVEEQFYLVWPFVIHRLSAKRVATLCLGLVVTALFVRVAMRNMGATPDMVYQFTVCRMDALAAGAFVAAIFRDPTAREFFARRMYQILGFAGGVLVLIAVTSHLLAANELETQTIGHTVLAVAFAAFVAFAVSAPARHLLQRALCIAPLRSLGKYSYGIYVLHLPIHAFWLGPLLGPKLHQLHSPGLAAVYVAIVAVTSYVAAVISYHVLEAPFLRMKRWFVPRPAVAPLPSNA